MTTEYIPGEQVYYHQILPKEFNKIEIIPVGDVHYKAPTFSKHHLDKVFSYIAGEPYRYILLLGDLLDCATKASVGDVYKQDVTPQQQRDWMISYLTPYKERVLGAVAGNHEERLYKEVGFDITKDIAEALHCPYRPEGMLLKISYGSGNDHVKDRQYVKYLYFTHGYGGARTLGAKVVKMERLASEIHADVYMSGHDHTSAITPIIYLMPDDRSKYNDSSGFQMGTVKSKRKLLIKTNAFLKWGGYSERQGFAPTDLERVTLIFDRNSVTATL